VRFAFGTIRSRLVALSVAVLTSSFLLFGFFAYATFSYSLWRRHDDGLKATVNTVATALRTGIRVEKGDELEAAHHILNELRFPRRKIGIYTTDGNPFPLESTKPDDPQHAHGPPIQIGVDELAGLIKSYNLDISTDEFTMLTRETGSGQARMALMGFVSSAGNRYIVAAEESNIDVTATLDLLRNALVIAVPVFLLFACAAGWFLAERSLAPVAAMTQRARTITERNLDSRLPVANARDELGEFALVVNDLLDRLERAFVQMRRFIADASHELRTPLAAMRAETQVALKRDRPSVEYRDSLEVIQEEATHMARIVEDLFTLARADAGDRPLERSRFYLDELVSDCCRTARSLADTREIELDFFAHDEIEIDCDELLVRRAVLNLLDNAVKYTERGGSVRVEVARSGSFARIDVTDTGIGISPENRERVVERFYRVDKARVRSEGGAGLGLSIVQWVVDEHDGAIELSSETGIGTTVSILLPLPVPFDDSQQIVATSSTTRK